MSTLLQAKQIKKVVSSAIPLTGLSSGTSNTLDITTALTTALATAANQGGSVPLQSSADQLSMGAIANSPYNLVPIRNASTGAPFQSATGEEVYGRISTPDEVQWNLEFYTNEAGAETEYPFPANESIISAANYRFDFQDLPVDAPLMISGVFPADDPAVINFQPTSESLNITTTNQVPSLSQAPADTSEVHLFVNGMDEHIRDGAFTVAGTTITWNANAAGYDLEPTDVVVAEYIIDPAATPPPPITAN